MYALLSYDYFVEHWSTVLKSPYKRGTVRTVMDYQQSPEEQGNYNNTHIHNTFSCNTGSKL